MPFVCVCDYNWEWTVVAIINPQNVLKNRASLEGPLRFHVDYYVDQAHLNWQPGQLWQDLAQFWLAGCRNCMAPTVAPTSMAKSFLTAAAQAKFRAASRWLLDRLWGHRKVTQYITGNLIR